MRRRNDRPSILDDMDRMRRQRHRMALAILAVWVTMLVGVLYLLAHPETIGWYAGRVIAGAELAR